MSRIKNILLFSFVAILFFLFTPHAFKANAQSVQSNCIITKVGNPPANQPLPAGCGTGGGATKVIELARQQLGKKYVWGAPSRTWSANPPERAPNSFDCSGLVGWAWYWGSDRKVNFPGSTRATWGKVSSAKFRTFTSAQKDQIQPGDAIYWAVGNIHHTALYVGPGNCGAPTCIIEAQQTGVPVKESSFEGRINSKGDKWVGFIRPIY